MNFRRLLYRHKTSDHLETAFDLEVDKTYTLQNDVWLQ